MNDSGILDQIARDLTALISGTATRLFGPRIDQPVAGPITWSDLYVAAFFVISFFVLHGVAALFIKRKAGKANADAKHLKRNFLGALGKPVYLMIWIYGIYLSMTPFLLKLPREQLADVHHIFDVLFDLGIFGALLWFFIRFTRVIEAHLAAWAATTDGKLDDLLVPVAGKSLRILVPVLGIIFALPILNLPAQYEAIIGRASSILLIGAIAMILSQFVNLGEKYLLTKYDIRAADNLQARKLYTQVHVLGKTMYFLIALFAIASMLMLFDEVRRLGASLLASAGVVGVILGFAAQKTIANLFAGFQLAMTQPIRLDDVVIVEGEWGRIEEITLTYIIIHIWDDRRLVVPLSYFIEKPFQNWTRATSQLLGSVFVWVDYSLPLEEARKALKEIIESHPLWDKRFWNLQVSDASEKTMQLRVLATSADSSKSWDLRCAIREQFIAYIQKHHPRCLPKFRAEVQRGTL
jgi:small-conductance mechanosensitive channel